MSTFRMLDAAGRPRSPATIPGYLAGRAPRNKGRRYPADPPRVEGDRRGHAPGRTGALELAERDLDPGRGAILVRSGKGGKRREVGMDDWGWEQLRPWLGHRAEMPIGALFCVVNGPTCGRPWSAPAVRVTAAPARRRAGVRRRFAPLQLRHAHAVEMAREGMPLNVIQRHLGHADLGVTSVYLQGIDGAFAPCTDDARERRFASVREALIALRSSAPNRFQTAVLVRLIARARSARPRGWR
jgi:Phage integrase family